MGERFYVYRLFDLGGTIYIGKGSGQRLRQQMRRFGCMGEIVKQFQYERAAYAFERKMIRNLKPIKNRCAGGGGPRSSRVLRRSAWEIEAERLGSQVYAAREMLKFDLSPFLSPSKIDGIRRVANAGA